MFGRVGVDCQVECGAAGARGGGVDDDVFDPDAGVMEFGLMSGDEEQAVAMAEPLARLAADFGQGNFLERGGGVGQGMGVVVGVAEQISRRRPEENLAVTRWSLEVG